VPREMVMADVVALNVNIPTYVSQRQLANPRFAFAPPGQGDGASGDADPNQRRRERIEELKEQFRRATAYNDVRKKALAQTGVLPPSDPRLDALVPYALGEKPVILRAEHRTEILDAIKVARELKVKAVISGGRDAWKVADALKAAGVPVLVAGTLRLPAEPTDPYDALYANPARLFEAGVTFAIRSKDAGPEAATAPRNLPYEAATAVAFGLPEAEAVKAVTLSPAKILGVSDKLGSIEPGKRADLVIAAGHILQPATEVKGLFMNGKPVAPKSRHSQLYDTYRKRLADVKSGAAPLGIDGRPAINSPSPTPARPTVGPAGTDASGSRR
jgi:imidazolonepropionase-like amidohydrolase